MARGDRREEIFRDDRDRWKFLGYLAEGAERYRVKVYCYWNQRVERPKNYGQNKNWSAVGAEQILERVSHSKTADPPRASPR